MVGTKYEEITPPTSIVFRQYPANEAGDIISNPQMPNWPKEMRTTINLEEANGKTQLQSYSLVSMVGSISFLLILFSHLIEFLLNTHLNNLGYCSSIVQIELPILVLGICRYYTWW
jgi:hypothetical protein